MDSKKIIVPPAPIEEVREIEETKLEAPQVEKEQKKQLGHYRNFERSSGSDGSCFGWW